MKFERITIDPAVYTGKPCFRWLRFPVSRLLCFLASGETPDTILRDYPYLEKGNIEEALQYSRTQTLKQVQGDSTNRHAELVSASISEVKLL